MSELIQHLKAVPNCVHYSALIHEAARELENIAAEREALQAKLDFIVLKFKSGNSIPVERITVKRDEFYKLEGKGDE